MCPCSSGYTSDRAAHAHKAQSGTEAWPNLFSSRRIRTVRALNCAPRNIRSRKVLLKVPTFRVIDQDGAVNALVNEHAAPCDCRGSTLLSPRLQMLQGSGPATGDHGHGTVRRD